MSRLCNAQAPIILVRDTEPKFIDFIGTERFDLIIDSYLMNIVNCTKIKGQEAQVAQLIICKYGKKIKGAQVFQIFVCLAWKISYLKDEFKDEFVSSEGV